MSSEQISTASKEASGTGNMKFMLNGALTLGTMDGANVEIVEEVGAGECIYLRYCLLMRLSIMRTMAAMIRMRSLTQIRRSVRVLMQLINGTLHLSDPELFRDIYNSLLNTKNSAKAGHSTFILKDFRSYAEAQKKVEAAYRDEKGWAKNGTSEYSHAVANSLPTEPSRSM